MEELEEPPTKKLDLSDAAAKTDALSSDPPATVQTSFYSLSERNLILLLALLKKFSSLGLLQGRLTNAPLAHALRIADYLLVWGTISNIRFPVVLDLNKLLSLSPDDKGSSNEALAQQSALFLSVLSLGAAEFGRFSDAIIFQNQAWSLVLQRLQSPAEILEPLAVLSYISLNFLQELSYCPTQPSVSVHTVFQCLNEVLSTVVETKPHGSALISAINYYKSHGLPVPPALLPISEPFCYWHVYNLLLSYLLHFGKSPPKAHPFFLDRLLPEDSESLKEALQRLSTLPSLFKSTTSGLFSNSFKNLTLREYTIIMGLLNELQGARLGNASLFSSKNVLHNTIIMANKLMHTNLNYRSAQPAERFGSKSHGVHLPNEPNLSLIQRSSMDMEYLLGVNSFLSMLVNSAVNQDLINVYNLVIVLKKRVLLGCPSKLVQDLLIDYVVVPNHEAYWALLSATIKEFTLLNREFSKWPDDDTMRARFQRSALGVQGPHGSASFLNGAYGVGPYASVLFSPVFLGFADLIHDMMRGVADEDIVFKITRFLTNGPDHVAVNNNLGLALLPLLFIGYMVALLSPQGRGSLPEDMMLDFLHRNGLMASQNLVFLRYFLKLPKNFVNLLIEDFFILVKLFYSFRHGRDSETAKMIALPILQAIVYLIREMSPGLYDDSFPPENFSLGETKNGVCESLVNAKDDTVLYFYLKNIENVFVTWLNFLNQGNQGTVDNYNTRLIGYVEKVMEGLYKNLNFGREKNTSSLTSIGGKQNLILNLIH